MLDQFLLRKLRSTEQANWFRLMPIRNIGTVLKIT